MARRLPQRVVEVKHGKRKVDIVVEGAATVAWLMEEIFTETGVLLKHQKLLCKGKQLVSTETVDAQCMFKNGKTTVMLLASAGRRRAASSPTAGQQALAASRKAKFDAMVAQKDDARRKRRGWSTRRIPGSHRRFARRRLAIHRDRGHARVGIANDTERGVRDRTGKRASRTPRRTPSPRCRDASAEWSTGRRSSILGKNKLTLESIDWEALATLTSLTHLRLDENDLAGALPRSVAFAMPRLEVLALDGNRIASLPDDEEPTATDSVAADDDAAEKRYFPAPRARFLRSKPRHASPRRVRDACA